MLILGILAILILFLSFARTLPTGESGTSDNDASTQPQKTDKVGWDIPDDLLEMKKAFVNDEAITSIPEWRLFTIEYFRDLKARNVSIAKWVRERPTKPVLHYIPLIHDNITVGDSDEVHARIDDFQLRLFEQCHKLSKEAQALAIEYDGCKPNEVITRDVWARMLRMGDSRYGFQMTDKEVNDSIKYDKRATTHAILAGETPVICGEEWPHMLEAELIQIEARIVDPPQVLHQMINALTYLRSEIIVIKTLEFLRANNGSAGIIVQGFAHQKMIERYASLLGIHVNTYLQEGYSTNFFSQQ